MRRRRRWWWRRRPSGLPTRDKENRRKEGRERRGDSGKGVGERMRERGERESDSVDCGVWYVDGNGS
jgi:hypothetical protein